MNLAWIHSWFSHLGEPELSRWVKLNVLGHQEGAEVLLHDAWLRLLAAVVMVVGGTVHL